MSAPACTRCGGAKMLRSGSHCPDCTHVIEYKSRPWGRAIALPHVVTCSCGWRHSETSRQNALGRASKQRAAVAKHLRETEEGKPI